MGRTSPPSYNDYDIEKPEKRHKVLGLARWLRSRGVQIDGVGIQGHINLDWPKLQDLAVAIDEIADEGLLVKISELDISVYTRDDKDKNIMQPECAHSSELEEGIAARYAEVFSVLRDKASKLASVTLWGVSDDQSWLNHWPIKRRNYPLLFDRQHRPKAAFFSIMRS